MPQANANDEVAVIELFPKLLDDKRSRLLYGYQYGGGYGPRFLWGRTPLWGVSMCHIWAHRSREAGAMAAWLSLHQNSITIAAWLTWHPKVLITITMPIIIVHCLVVARPRPTGP